MDYLLKTLLSNKKTKQAIGEFCASKQEYCRSNRETVCERILHVSGYKTKNFFKGLTTSFCKLYSELTELSSDITMSDELLENIRSNASSDLRAFIVFNGYNVSPRSLGNRWANYKLFSDITVKTP